MKSFRMMGAVLCAIFALAIVGVSSAAAAAPEFNPSTTQKFTFTSGAGVLAATGNSVNCTSDSGTGEITGAKTVANVHVSFKGCADTTSSGTCSVKSVAPAPVGAAGEIETVTLKGSLGAVAAAEAATEAGLLLEPVSGSEYTTIGAGTCSVETKVTGKIAGEVAPVKKLQRTGTLTFALNGTKQKIKELGGVEVPSLKAFGTAATESSTENIQFTSNVEVT